MESVLEIIMGVLLDAAMFILVLHLVKNQDGERKGFRFAALTFAAGFALGVACKCFAGGGYAAMILYLLGFMLAYAAFLFTFPGKRKHHEGR